MEINGNGKAIMKQGCHEFNHLQFHNFGIWILFFC